MDSSTESHSQLAQDLVDEMIRTAVMELFDTAGASLTPERTQYGSLPVEIERFEFGTRVGFSGVQGSGFLMLGCGADVVPEGAGIASDAWIVERAQAFGSRLEKRLRQFGITVRLEAPELLSKCDIVPAVEAPALRCTYLFGAGAGGVCVHLDGDLDVERIASSGEVPLRDEGDIILF